MRRGGYQINRFRKIISSAQEKMASGDLKQEENKGGDVLRSILINGASVPIARCRLFLLCLMFSERVLVSRF